MLGTIDDLKPRLQLEAHRQIGKAPLAWMGARGFWRLYRCRTCYWYPRLHHAAQHLWKAVSVYQTGNPNRTSQNWFEGLRHRLRMDFEAVNSRIASFESLSFDR